MIQDAMLPGAKPKRFAQLELVGLSMWTNDFVPAKYDNVHYELDDVTGKYKETARTPAEPFL